jgi:predicted metalloprotease
MKWTSRGPSSDLEDRRGFSVARAAPIGLGGLAVLFVLSLLTGQDFLSVLDTGDGTAAPAGPAPPASTTPAEENMVNFVSFVLDDAQATWDQLLQGRYRHAKLVLFRDATQSACGFAESATGPFYCPGDERVYVDLGFYQELRDRFGAGGDFAQAYVLTHEIGHHVQKLLGTEEAVRRGQRADPSQVNALSVRLELQADCFAGIWGHATRQRQLLENGDIEEALNAAAAIGDDRIMRSAGARVAPERFTHGSSTQRVDWFKRGFDQGRIEACNTFE